MASEYCFNILCYKEIPYLRYPKVATSSIERQHY